MAKQFGSASAFKAALEVRLRKGSQESGVPFSTLQLKFVMERLLARLFQVEPTPWLLKGGFAMDLRYRPQARTTKDIDLSVFIFGPQAGPKSSDLRDRLQAAAEVDLGDYLTKKDRTCIAKRHAIPRRSRPRRLSGRRFDPALARARPAA